MEETIFEKRYVFSLEWKSEDVMDDDSGDSEEDEVEEDWFRKGWRSDLEKADVVKQEVCSRDVVKHVGKNSLWFSTRNWLEGEKE